MKILYLHGWQSVPGGVKPTYLASHGHTVINPKLPDDDFPAAVRIAQAEFASHHPDVIVGSSRGAAVAMNLNSGDTPSGAAVPGLEEARHCQDRQEEHDAPTLTGRRRGAVLRQRGTGPQQRAAWIGAGRGRQRS